MTQNEYAATAVVRIKDDKCYLYDIVNIKKKRVGRFSHNDFTVRNRLFCENNTTVSKMCQVCFGISYLWGVMERDEICILLGTGITRFLW